MLQLNWDYGIWYATKVSYNSWNYHIALAPDEKLLHHFEISLVKKRRNPLVLGLGGATHESAKTTNCKFSGAQLRCLTNRHSTISVASFKGSSDVRSCGSKKGERNRRSWTSREEMVLIAAMKELITQGWKSDNGYRAGYLNRLESALKKEIPNCELNVVPHINSRLATWKKMYNSLSQMLNRSGVGFNTKGNHMIECEDDQWEQIVKMDPNAKGMRYKNWPYYDDWKELFGKDRATGKNAEDIYEAFAAMQTSDDIPADIREATYENDLNGMDFDRTSQSAQDGPEARRVRGGKKRKTPQRDLDGVCQLLAEMNESTNTRLEHIANRIGYEFDMGKARQEVLSQLGDISGLSSKDKFQICEMVAFKAERLDIWRGMDVENRMEYVEHLLNGHGF